ncbi:MAG: hypothetical protein D6718_04380 [Acidobacteria bacterium]|nr:MAG: hypothetical protein D6718_04380 [Acidobacteriota bacterium]
MTIFAVLLAFLAGLLIGGLALSAAGRGSRSAAAEGGPYDRILRTALARLASGDHRGAVAALRRATAMRPRDDAVYLLLAEELRRLGDRSRAERGAQVILAARDLDPDVESAAWLLRGRLAEERGETDAALEAYARAESSRPDAAPAIVARGRLLSRLRRWREAIEAAGRLAAVEPERARLIAARRRVLLARELLAEGRPDAALVEAKAALNDAPDLTAARITVGDALFQIGKVQQACAAWLEAARAAPSRAALILDRLEQASSGAPAGAARRLAEELAGTGADWRPLAWLVHDSLLAGRADEAARWFERLQQVAPAAATTSRLAVRLAAARNGSAGALESLLSRWERERVWTDPWRCSRCGRETGEFEWRCPDCQAWDSFH